MSSRRKVVAESVDIMEIVPLTVFVILSFPPNALKAETWSCTRAVIDSTVWQLWSFTANGCWANAIPVVFSYACNADSNNARN